MTPAAAGTRRIPHLTDCVTRLLCLLVALPVGILWVWFFPERNRLFRVFRSWVFLDVGKLCVTILVELVLGLILVMLILGVSMMMVVFRWFRVFRLLVFLEPRMRRISVNVT